MAFLCMIALTNNTVAHTFPQERLLRSRNFDTDNVTSQNLRNGTREERDGKSCVTRVTIILFETPFRQTSPSFKQISL